jgi:hypothetical protein
MTSEAISKFKPLYASLLRAANKFPEYNFRNFAIRKVKYDFDLTKINENNLDQFVSKVNESLSQLKRMTKVHNLYTDGKQKLIIE